MLGSVHLLVLARTLEQIPRHLESPYVFYHRKKGESAGGRFVELNRAWLALLPGVDQQRAFVCRRTQFLGAPGI